MSQLHCQVNWPAIVSIGRGFSLINLDSTINCRGHPCPLIHRSGNFTSASRLSLSSVRTRTVGHQTPDVVRLRCSRVDSRHCSPRHSFEALFSGGCGESSPAQASRAQATGLRQQVRCAGRKVSGSAGVPQHGVVQFSAYMNARSDTLAMSIRIAALDGYTNQGVWI